MDLGGIFLLLLIVGLPLIWVVWNILRLFIIDPISDKIKESERKRHYGEEHLINVTTYQNDNISENDIMKLFLSQWKLYKQKYRYYIFEYKVFNDKDKQNYAWSIKTTRNKYGWGTVIDIFSHFTNGWILLKFSDNQFNVGDKSSNEYYIYGFEAGSNEILTALNTCREEARIMWKMNGKEQHGDLPFNYYSISDNINFFENKNNEKRKESTKTNSSSKSSNSNYDQKESNKNSSKEQFTPPDLIAFYRNLLGLKLRFTQNELKTAYREAVANYHPDKYGSASTRDRKNAETLMKQINEAHEVLKKYAE